MKYKIAPYDLANDIWIVKKKFLFLWITYVPAGAGGKDKMSGIVENLNGIY